MATSGKDTGIVGYNVQAAVDTQTPDRRPRGDDFPQMPLSAGSPTSEYPYFFATIK